MLSQAAILAAEISNSSKIAEIRFLNDMVQPLRVEARAENGSQEVPAPEKNTSL
jgi:hypothetical protein